MKLKRFPRVSIIILNWNGLNDTVDCLESLRKITYPNYNIIVVDNASEGEDVQVLRRKYGKWIYLIENKRNYYYSEGNNIGIRYALKYLDPDYILILNNDVVVDADFLSYLVDVAESNKLFGLLSPTVFFYEDHKRIQYCGEKIRWFRLVSEKLCNFSTGNVQPVLSETASGSCMLIRRAVINKIGLFDSQKFPFLVSDIDYSLRTLKGGFKIVVVPISNVWHKTSKSVEKVPYLKIKHQIGESLILKYEYMWGPLFWIYMILFPFIYGPIMLAGYLLRYKKLSVIKPFFEGLTNALTYIYAKMQTVRKKA